MERSEAWTILNDLSINPLVKYSGSAYPGYHLIPYTYNDLESLLEHLVEAKMFQGVIYRSAQDLPLPTADLHAMAWDGSRQYSMVHTLENNPLLQHMIQNTGTLPSALYTDSYDIKTLAGALLVLYRFELVEPHINQRMGKVARYTAQNFATLFDGLDPVPGKADLARRGQQFIQMANATQDDSPMSFAYTELELKEALKCLPETPNILMAMNAMLNANPYRTDHGGLIDTLYQAFVELLQRRTGDTSLELTDLDFERAQLYLCNFTNLNLQNADFNHSLLDSCDFSGANLNGANLQSSTFIGGSLRSSSLINTNFDSAITSFDPTPLYGAKDHGLFDTNGQMVSLPEADHVYLYENMATLEILLSSFFLPAGCKFQPLPGKPKTTDVSGAVYGGRYAETAITFFNQHCHWDADNPPKVAAGETVCALLDALQNQR